MPRSPQDLYASRLLRLSPHRGYPLWTPEPSNELLAERPEGLRIGDVGVVLPDDGGFDVFFNLCLPHNHRFHCRYGVPEGFTCIHPQELDIRTIQFAEHPGRVISTSSVFQVGTVRSSSGDILRDDSGASTYRFNMSPDEGALLILPEGAERHELLNDGLFIEQASKNGAEWYNYAMNRRHRMISQGALYVITGLYKTRSWSVAAFENISGNEPREAQVKHILDNGYTTATYTWETNRANLDWRAGSSIDYGTPSQAVFIRGLKIALRKFLRSKWITVEADLPSTRPNPMKFISAVPSNPQPSRDGFARPAKRESRSTSRSDVHAKGPTDTVDAWEALSDTPDENEHEDLQVEIQRIPHVPPAFHPSDAINRYLLRKDPSADIAITCDSVWISILDNGLLTMEEFGEDTHLETVLSQHYHVISHEGVIRLERLKESILVDPQMLRAGDIYSRLETMRHYLRQRIISRASTIPTVSVHDSGYHSLLQTVPPPPRHVIFFGETGSGKSSIINLLLGAPLAAVANDAQPCTENSTRYETSLCDQKYILWDTRGLGSERSSNSIQAILRRSSRKDLENFLKEKYCRREIDLLVYCVQGLQETQAYARNYNNFCTISRQLAAPVVIVVTHLEREKDMEEWWTRNTPAFEALKMDFDGYACITTLPGPQLAESKKNLVNLITRDYDWEPKGSGSYFGSPIRVTQSAPPHPKGGMFGSMFKSKHKDNINDRHHYRQRNISSLSATTDSAWDSYYDLVPPSPIIVPSIPRSIATSINVASINAAPVEVGPSGEDTDSTESSPGSMTHNSSESSIGIKESSTQGRSSCLIELPIENLTGKVRNITKAPTQSGAFGDVWECNLARASGQPPLKVAVKVIKTTPKEHELHRKTLYRELKIWWRLDHRNIVPLIGVVYDFGLLPGIVSRWFSNGSLSNYLIAHPELSTSERRRMIRDVTAGLCYLHSQDIVHGNLHTGNILIDDDSTACLTDFGHSIIKDFVGTSYLDSSFCGSVLFADPALVKRVVYDTPGEISYPTKPCDVYSFGGLILHVLSGKVPYSDSSNPFVTVMRGERPRIPTNISPEDVLIIQSCWDHEERNRPSVDSLSNAFRES